MTQAAPDSESTVERTTDVPEPQAQGSGDGVEAITKIFDKWRGGMMNKGFGSPSSANAVDAEAKAAIELLLIESKIELLRDLEIHNDGTVYSAKQDKWLPAGEYISTKIAELEALQSNQKGQA